MQSKIKPFCNSFINLTTDINYSYISRGLGLFSFRNVNYHDQERIIESPPTRFFGVRNGVKITLVRLQQSIQLCATSYRATFTTGLTKVSLPLVRM